MKKQYSIVYKVRRQAVLDRITHLFFVTVGTALLTPALALVWASFYPQGRVATLFINLIVWAA